MWKRAPPAPGPLSATGTQWSLVSKPTSTFPRPAQGLPGRERWKRFMKPSTHWALWQLSPPAVSSESKLGLRRWGEWRSCQHWPVLLCCPSRLAVLSPVTPFFLVWTTNILTFSNFYLWPKYCVVSLWLLVTLACYGGERMEGMSPAFTASPCFVLLTENAQNTFSWFIPVKNKVNPLKNLSKKSMRMFWGSFFLFSCYPAPPKQTLPWWSPHLSCLKSLWPITLLSV